MKKKRDDESDLPALINSIDELESQSRYLLIVNVNQLLIFFFNFLLIFHAEERNKGKYEVLINSSFGWDLGKGEGIIETILV